MKDYPKDFGFSVSHTTREPRPGEEEGVDYFYRDKDSVAKMIERGEMLEYATVFGKDTYGTSVSSVQSVLDDHRNCILDIDIQGVLSVKESQMRDAAIYIFIAPPSMDILEARLRGRGTESEEKIERRLNTARKEIVYMDKENFWDAVLVNDDLEKCYTKLVSTIANNVDLISS